MVKRNEIGILRRLWLRGHGLSVEPGLQGLSSRVRRAAPSLQMRPVEPVVASRGATKAGTVTMLSNDPAE